MAGKVTIRRRNFMKPVALAGASKVEVGFPAGEALADIAQRAIWTHYGTSKGVPARPFLLNSMRDNRLKYLNILKASAPKLLLGKLTLDLVTRQLGIMAQGDVQQEITTLRDPPNAPSTIERKGSSNPLIDTGQMRQSVTYRVTT